MDELQNKVVFMTGATSGFGSVIAKYIIDHGAKLYILARDHTKSQGLVESVDPILRNKLHIISGNLSSFESVMKACDELKTKVDQVDIIINNAGLWLFKHKVTTDNIEETLQVNVLSPLAIINELYDILPKDGSAKIINTASGLHQGKINFEDIEFRKKFSGFKAYRQSKLGVILIGHYLAKKLEQDSINIYSVHPGMIKTNLAQHAGWFSRQIFLLMASSVQKGAQTHIHLLKTPAKELSSGGYYANSRLTSSSSESNNLNTAQRLIEVCKDYLEPHIKVHSQLFS